MITIQKKHNPFIEQDELEIEVSDAVHKFLLRQRQEERNYRRQVKDKISFFGTAGEILDQTETPCPIDTAIKREEAENVRQALDKLSEIQRRRVVARFFEKMSYAEIAQMEGIRVSAIHNSISQAITRLRKVYLDAENA